jgi:hypothetical protein
MASDGHGATSDGKQEKQEKQIQKSRPFLRQDEQDAGATNSATN